MFTFLLVIHAIIAAALVTVILMQRSEGGGLGMGGSPSGLMSARGAADFLTRATTILAALFVLLSIGLAAYATMQRGPRDYDTSLTGQTGALNQQPGAPAPADPLAAAAAAGAASGNSSAPMIAAPAPKAAAAPAEKSKPKPATPAPEKRAVPAPVANAAPTPVVVTPPAPAPGSGAPGQ